MTCRFVSALARLTTLILHQQHRAIEFTITQFGFQKRTRLGPAPPSPALPSHTARASTYAAAAVGDGVFPVYQYMFGR